MKCAFCHEEIGTIKALKGGNMINLHFNDRGQLEKCYIKLKFPFNLIFGKKKYPLRKAELVCNSPWRV